MFTGIIEEVGKIESIKTIAGGRALVISAEKILYDFKAGDSISVNGVCLTVTVFSSKNFSVDAVGETLNKTTIGALAAGSLVNLESALQLSKKLGGHIVQGHINGFGEISEIKKHGENYSLSIIVPQELAKYLIREGSIAIDGISLTIAQTTGNKCSFSIIPHTWQNTNLSERKIRDKVNIEIDVIAKYVEKLMFSPEAVKSQINEDWLYKLGY